MKYRDEDYEYEKRRRELEQRKRTRPDAEMTSQRRRNSSQQAGSRSAGGQDSYARRCSQSYGSSQKRTGQGYSSSESYGSRRPSGTANSSAGRAPQGSSAGRSASAAGVRQPSRTVRPIGVDPYDRSYSSSNRSAGDGYYSDMSARKRQRPVEEPVGKRGKKQLSAKTKKRKRTRKVLFAVEGILLCLVLACLFVLSKWDLIQKASFGKKDVHVNDLSQNVIESMEGFSTIAVFGVDTRTLETGRSDVIMIINVNNATKEVKLASVLRDTYWNVPDATTGNENKYAKANNAYHTGGAENALKALNKNLDLQITDYVTVNWYAVSLAIDHLGGIDIDVPESMMGEINGYITETVESTGRGSHHLTESGYQHLDGIQAVAFCRIRHNNGGDDGRADRQRQVVGLMLEQAKKAGPTTLLKICETVFPEVSTNLTLAQVISLAGSANDYQITQNIAFPYHQVDALVGSASVKVPLGLAEDVTQLHSDLFGDTSYSPSETVKQISNKIESQTGYGLSDRND